VSVLFGLVNGSNRRWLAGMLRMDYRPVLTVHRLCLANLHFVRAVAASPDDAVSLERRGASPYRWRRVRP
jgi:hypothetical protein